MTNPGSPAALSTLEKCKSTFTVRSAASPLFVVSVPLPSTLCTARRTRNSRLRLSAEEHEAIENLTKFGRNAISSSPHSAQSLRHHSTSLNRRSTASRSADRLREAESESSDVDCYQLAVVPGHAVCHGQAASEGESSDLVVQCDILLRDASSRLVRSC